MQTSPVHWIAAEIGWGAKRHETELGPSILAKQLSIHYDKIIQCPTSFKTVSSLTYPEKLKEVEKVSKDLMHAVKKSIRDKFFPIIIGGDESIGIGTWSGVILQHKAQQQFGLIWFDAHMDAHTPETSPSMAIHGMPLAILLGAGEKSLVNLGGVSPKLSPKHVVLIGVRSYEKGEAAFLKKHKVKIYFIDEVIKRGLFAVVKEAVDYVQTNCIKFGVNIDLDVFDPKIAPAVGSPEPGGITNGHDILKSIKYVYHHPKFCALEISEYNPTLIYNEKTLKVIQKILHPWLLARDKK